MQIPSSARLFTIVDVWDALTHDRPYRKAWPEAKVLEYIRGRAGKDFDPVAVDNFFVAAIRTVHRLRPNQYGQHVTKTSPPSDKRLKTSILTEIHGIEILDIVCVTRRHVPTVLRSQWYNKGVR